MAKSTKRKAGRIAGILLGALFIVIGVASAAYWVTKNAEPVKPVNNRPKLNMSSGDVVRVRPHKYQTVALYVVKTSGEESALVPQKVNVPARADRYEASVVKLLELAGSPESTIPDGTTLRSLEISGDLAVVDLSREFIDNFSGGSEEESLAINAIVRTIAQFGNIDKVQILVEGRKVGTLGGHFELEEPIDAKMASAGSGEISE